MHDLQTREKFYFICEKWLAVEKEDGQLERKLFVASEQEKTQLRLLFKNQAKSNLLTFNLLLALFSSSIQTKFNRLDRITCYFATLYFSLILISIYYDFSFKLFADKTTVLDMSFVSVTFEEVKLFIFISKVKKSIL